MISKEQLHILRFGTIGDKKYVANAISSFDCLGINGNIAVFVSNAITQFIASNFFNINEKGYFIDPITYSFQEEELLRKSNSSKNNPEIKLSISKLIQKYGYPADVINQHRSLEPSDFSSLQVKEDFCQNVLDFQYNLIYDHLQSTDLKQYLEFASEQLDNEKTLRPLFFIAPYFYIDKPNSEWLDINNEFIDISIKKITKQHSTIPLFAQLVISKELLLNKKFLKELALIYTKKDIQGINIWINNFDEHKASLEELNGFMFLLKELGDIPKYNMYGGFFSILLTHKDIRLLNGVSHSLEYGEYREVYPVGGGIPTSKYYFPTLHHRINFSDAYYLLSKANYIDTTKTNWGTPNKYYEDICNCPQCKRTIKNDMINFLTFESQESYTVKSKKGIINRLKASKETRECCLYHYLHSKKNEFDYVNCTPLKNILLDFNTNYDFYNNLIPISSKIKLDYLLTWKQSIEEFDNE